MLAPSGAESLLLIFVLLMYALAAFVLYWIIRLAVRHGIRDSRRPSASERAADVDAQLRRHQGG